MAGLMDLLQTVFKSQNPAKIVITEEPKKESNLAQMAQEAQANTPDYYNKLIGYEGLKTEAYDDTKGIPTIGVGHVIRKGEDFTGYGKKDFEKLFVEKDLPMYVNRTKSLINNFEQYPASVKEELVASVFRGGLSGSPKTVRLINEGKYQEASKEFLNNTEYKEAKQWEVENNQRHGVAVRMENLAKELNNLNRR